MPREDLEKLLGGYATNTLTDQERKELFEAALGDQTLFNALIDEQALKEVLDEPRSRRLLVEALRDRQARRSGIERLQAWVRSLVWQGANPRWVRGQAQQDIRTSLREPPTLSLPARVLAESSLSQQTRGGRVQSWRRPTTWALAGSVAVALLAVTLVVRLTGPLPDTSMRTASKAPVQPTSPIGPLESKPAPQTSEVDRAQAPPPDLESGTSQPLKRAPAARSPELRDETSSMPGNKDNPLSTVPPPVADEQQTASPPAPSAKKEPELRSSAKGAIVPAPHVTESFSGQGEAQTEYQETAQGKLQATGAEEKALGGAREQMRRLSPMAPTARSKDKNPVPGVRYSILQEEKDGTYSEVNPTTTFGSNDKARVAIEPNESGYLYVLERDTAGNSKLVFPPGGTGVTARVEKTVRYLVPPSGAFSFQEPGDILLTIILAREQLEDAQNLQNLRGLFMAPKKQKTERGEGIVGQESAGASATGKAPPLSRLDSESGISKQELTLKHQ